MVHPLSNIPSSEGRAGMPVNLQKRRKIFCCPLKCNVSHYLPHSLSLSAVNNNNNNNNNNKIKAIAVIGRGGP
jgi:hypothetical protein